MNGSEQTAVKDRPNRIVSVLVVLAIAIGGLLDGASAEASTSVRRLAWDVPGSTTTLPNGWTLTTTTTPLIKVSDQRGRQLGTIELGNYTLEAELARARNADELEDVLKLRAKRFHAIVGADKESLGYEYRSGINWQVSWGSNPAIRYRAKVYDAEGRVVERILGYQTVNKGQLWILTANGIGNGKARDGEDPLSVGQQEVLASYLKDVLSSSPPPKAGTAIESGMIAGTEGGLQGGRLWLIWEGKKQRIYQPGGMTERDARRYDKGVRTAQVIVTGKKTSSAFKVVPPSGSDARLYVLIGGRLHEVVVQHVKTSTVNALPTLEPLVLNRLVVPKG